MIVDNLIIFPLLDSVGIRMRRVMIALLAVFIVSAILQVPHGVMVREVSGDENTYSLLVPLYIYPGCEWDSIVNLKSLYPAASILVIANPSSGPGASKDDTYATYISNMKSGGVLVLGYVSTRYGSRSESDVESDIDRWIEWYGIDGIFFDEISTSLDKESYYQNLVSYLKNKGSYMAVGNPGTYDSGTLGDYESIFDTLVIYDESGYPSSWPSSGDSDKLGALVYGVEAFDGNDFHDLLNKAHYVYVTDDSGVNPWDTVASYLVDEVAAITNSEVSDYVLNVSSTSTGSHTVLSRAVDYDLQTLF
jgi:hypothetical protein